MTKMNPELKAKWVEALRSGEYQQGVMYLKRDGCFCCLGVLCEVAGLTLHDSVADQEADDYQPIFDLLNDADAKISAKLWQMNDGTGVSRPHSFVEIADYIEEHL